MKVSEIANCLQAKFLTGEELGDLEVESACGADLMSDVLAFVKNKTVLLTGLSNLQVVRTAEMLDVTCIVFVRGKIPGDDILMLAKTKDIPILTTAYTLYTACGLLYKSGVCGS